MTTNNAATLGRGFSGRVSGVGWMNLKRVLPAALMTGFVIFVLCLVVFASKVLILGNCDSKLGCSGSIWFSGLLGSIAGAISAIAYVIISPIRNMEDAHIKVATISGAILTPAVFTVMDWNTGEVGMVLGWFMISISVVFVCMKFLGKKHEIT